MLSKKDIYDQIGDGINIFPFNKENIKENSINLSVGRYAWTIDLPTGTNAQFAVSGNTITLQPHKITILFSKEVISLNNLIGGTFHSRVGTLAKGVASISTMIGPNYAGHLMVPVANETDTPIALNIGEQFISLVLHYLTSPNEIPKNATYPSHLDKLSLYNINLNQSQHQYLSKDWKTSFEGIQAKLKNSKSYKKFKIERFIKKISSIKNYLTIKTLISLVVTLALCFGVWKLALFIDVKYNADFAKTATISFILTLILSNLKNINSFLLKK